MACARAAVAWAAAAAGVAVRRCVGAARAGASSAAGCDAGAATCRCVVVGNLVAGGAGKTPTVIALVRLLRERGCTPGIVSRGYGRSADGVLEVEPSIAAGAVGDEPLLLQLRSGAPVCRRTRSRRRRRGAAAQRTPTSTSSSATTACSTALARDADGARVRRARRRQRLAAAGRPAARADAGARAAATASCSTTPRAPSTRCPVHLARASSRGVVAAGRRGGAASRAVAASAAMRCAARRLLAAAGIARPERFFAMLRGRRPDDRRAAAARPSRLRDAAVAGRHGRRDRHREGRRQAAAGRASAPTRVWVAALDFEPEPGFADALRRAAAAAAARRTDDSMDTRLIDLLVCPLCKGPLEARRAPIAARSRTGLPRRPPGVPDPRRHPGDARSTRRGRSTPERARRAGS